MSTLGWRGFRIIESSHRVVFAGEDWSRVRSPGRAARRRKKHRQNIKALYKPDPSVYRFGDMLVMHPATAATLRAEIAALQKYEDTRS